MEEDIWKKAKSNAANVMKNAGWVQWIHEGTNPATTSVDKTMNIVLSLLSSGKHCAKCMNINGCCFPRNNMPEYPLHPNCHCKIVPIDKVWATAECPIEKFEDYIFDKIRNHGKKALFESWGYGKIDSVWLQQEFERQAKEKYESGNFTLGKLDRYGQRISIEIELPRKDRMGTVKFISGWMVYPNGVIKNATPMGGLV